MTEPLFSIIVPTYDRQQLLSQALDSVLRQSESRWECLVVDDCSPRTPELPPDPRFRLLRRPTNGGGTATRNTGLAEARGAYIAFLDDDDLWLPPRLELARRGLARHPVSVVARRGLNSNGPPSVLSREGWVADHLLNGLTPHLGQTAVRREVVPLFDEDFDAVEDVDWWLRLSLYQPVAADPEVGLLYRAHTGVRNKNGVEARIRGSLLLLEKHHDWFAAHPAAAAFRWRRIGLLRLKVGDRSGARRAFVQSLRLRLSVRSAVHVARTFKG